MTSLQFKKETIQCGFFLINLNELFPRKINLTFMNLFIDMD